MLSQSDRYFVYSHTNKLNGKKYIGITKQKKPELRWGSNGRNYSSYFRNAIDKYGWANFDHEILYEGLTKEEACEAEISLIKQYNTQDRNFGYNITEGGTAPIMPEEIREKISIALLGNKNGQGIPCSEEKRRKISEAQKGIKFSDERRLHLSEAKKGKSHAPISAESRKKISDAHKKKPVYCVELNRVFPSIQECGRQMNIDATSICACCRGRFKSIKGYHFNYADNI